MPPSQQGRRIGHEFLGVAEKVKAPAETFTGDAWYDVIARGARPAPGQH